MEISLASVPSLPAAQASSPIPGQPAGKVAAKGKETAALDSASGFETALFSAQARNQNSKAASEAEGRGVKDKGSVENAVPIPMDALSDFLAAQATKNELSQKGQSKKQIQDPTNAMAGAVVAPSAQELPSLTALSAASAGGVVVRDSQAEGSAKAPERKKLMPQDVWNGPGGADPLAQAPMEKTTKREVPNWLKEWNMPAIQAGAMQAQPKEFQGAMRPVEMREMDFKDLGRMGKSAAGIKQISGDRVRDEADLSAFLWPAQETRDAASESPRDAIAVSDHEFLELLSDTPVVPGTPDFKANVTLGANGQARLPTPVIHQVRDQLEQVAVSGMRTLPGGTQEMRIRLQPENLGEIQLQVLTRGNQVGVRVLTSTAQAKQIFERSWNDLRDRLAEKDLELGRLEVKSQDSELARGQSIDTAWGELLTQGSSLDPTGAWAPVRNHAGAPQDYSGAPMNQQGNTGFESASGGYAQSQNQREAREAPSDSFGGAKAAAKAVPNRVQRSGYGNSRIDLVA